MNKITKPGVKIIGLHGKAGSGKDTTAEIIWDNFAGTYKFSLAAPMREVLAMLFQVDPDIFLDRVRKEVYSPELGKTPREALQFFGTEIIRKHYGENFWVNHLAQRINEASFWEPKMVAIITDVRFQNEYDWIIQNNGIVVHLTRPGADGTVGISGHESEKDINLHCKERTIHVDNNSSIIKLHSSILDAVTSYIKR